MPSGSPRGVLSITVPYGQLHVSVTVTIGVSQWIGKRTPTPFESQFESEYPSPNFENNFPLRARPRGVRL